LVGWFEGLRLDEILVDWLVCLDEMRCRFEQGEREEEKINSLSLIFS